MEILRTYEFMNRSPTFLSYVGGGMFVYYCYLLKEPANSTSRIKLAHMPQVSFLEKPMQRSKKRGVCSPNHILYSYRIP